jgi:hypothetical protein
MKKGESWLNTFTYAVTYILRCNTDVTSLRSGTAIKGVLLYVSNYVTKPALKTHVIFDTVRSMFQKHSEMIGGDDTRKDKARKLMTKIVNSLSAKMEMGSPMACMYLLGNPDHYTNYSFVPFYWKSFVQEARKQWEPQQTPLTSGADNNSSSECTKAIEDLEGKQHEKVAIFKRNGRVIGLSPVHDYVFRPAEFHSICLYDWISRHQREKKSVTKNRKGPKQDDAALDAQIDGVSSVGYSDNECSNVQLPVSNLQPKSKSELHTFMSDHPLADTHGSRWSKRVRIPNFVGGTLPRCDQGDREYYCSTMLTLFRPWRSGLDLKSEGSSWDETFLSYQFSPCQLDLMKNMNLRYECLDARDDFHAQMQKGAIAMPNWADQGTGIFQDLDQIAVEEVINGHTDTNTVLDDFAISTHVGKRDKARTELMTEMRRMLSMLGWMDRKANLLPDNLTGADTDRANSKPMEDCSSCCTCGNFGRAGTSHASAHSHLWSEHSFKFELVRP